MLCKSDKPSIIIIIIYALQVPYLLSYSLQSCQHRPPPNPDPICAYPHINTLYCHQHSSALYTNTLGVPLYPHGISLALAGIHLEISLTGIHLAWGCTALVNCSSMVPPLLYSHCILDWPDLPVPLL